MLFPVTLHIVDLSQGMATLLSPSLLGKQINGVWHTSLCVHDREYFFAQGINITKIGATQYGIPTGNRRVELGKTEMDLKNVNRVVEEMRSQFK
jgi:hypothetical protein